MRPKVVPEIEIEWEQPVKTLLDYDSERAKLIDQMKSLPKKHPLNAYGKNILELIQELRENDVSGIPLIELTKTLNVTRRAMMPSSDPIALADECLEQKNAFDQYTTHPKVNQIGRWLCSIAGFLLIAASVAAAITTHGAATPLCILGIKIGESLIAATGASGAALVLASIGLYATKKSDQA